jgi:hypothetical protein
MATQYGISGPSTESATRIMFNVLRRTLEDREEVNLELELRFVDVEGEHEVVTFPMNGPTYMVLNELEEKTQSEVETRSDSVLHLHVTV